MNMEQKTDRAVEAARDRETEAAHSGGLVSDGATCDHAFQIGEVCSLCVNLPQFAPETCEWTLDQWDGAHHTSCGEAFCLDDGALKDNSIRYCCYCGKPVKEVIARDEEE